MSTYSPNPFPSHTPGVPPPPPGGGNAGHSPAGHNTGHLPNTTPSNLPIPMGASFQSAVLIFLKSLSAPIVLYSEHPTQLYEEIRTLIKTAQQASPKLIEKQGAGPLKKVSFLDTELSGVALQSEGPSSPR